MEGYRCEATTLEGFVQQLAVGYISRGYWFYSAGFIPERKNPSVVDEKLIARYDIAMSKWARARRKQAGAASIQYLRFHRFFVLLATHGKHRFFEQEASNIRDVRRAPILVGGYSVSLRGGRPHVRIDREHYLRLKAYFAEAALRRSPERLRAELAALPFEPYAPIRSQYCAIFRLMNRERQQAGLPLVSTSLPRLKRRIYRPFEPLPGTEAGSLKDNLG